MLLRCPSRIGTALLAVALCAMSAPAQEEDKIDFDALLRAPEELAKLEVRHTIAWWKGPLSRYELIFTGDGSARIRTWSRGHPGNTLMPVCSGNLSQEVVEQIVARFSTWRLYELDDNQKPGVLIMNWPDADSHGLTVTHGQHVIRRSFWGYGREKPRNLPHPALVELSHYIWEVARKVNYKCRLVEGDQASSDPAQ